MSPATLLIALVAIVLFAGLVVILRRSGLFYALSDFSDTAKTLFFITAGILMLLYMGSCTITSLIELKRTISRKAEEVGEGIKSGIERLTNQGTSTNDVPLQDTSTNDVPTSSPFPADEIRQWFKDHRQEGWQRLPVADIQHQTLGKNGFELVTNLAFMDGGTLKVATSNSTISDGFRLNIFNSDYQGINAWSATRIPDGTGAIWANQYDTFGAFSGFGQDKRNRTIPQTIRIDATPPTVDPDSRSTLGYHRKSPTFTYPQIFERLQRKFSPITANEEQLDCLVIPLLLADRELYFDLHVEFLHPEDLYGNDVLRLSMTPSVLDQFTPIVTLAEDSTIVYSKNCFHPVFRTSSEELHDLLLKAREEQKLPERPESTILGITCSAPMRVHVVLRVRSETVIHTGPARSGLR